MEFLGIVVTAFLIAKTISILWPSAAEAADSAATVRCESRDIESIKFTFGADATAGTWDWLNNLVCYIPNAVDVSDDAEGVVFFRMKRASLPKATGVTWTAGDLLFYSTVTDDFSNVTRATTDVPAGIALEDAASGATEALGKFEGDRLARLTGKVTYAGTITSLSN